MKSKFAKLMLMLAMAVGVNVSPPEVSAITAEPTRGVVRVKLQPEAARKLGAHKVAAKGAAITTGVMPFDASVSKIKAVSIERMIPYNAKFEARRAKYGLDRWYEIKFDASVEPTQAMQVLKATAGVQEVSLVRPMQLIGAGNVRVLDKNAPLKAATSAMPFNDPRLPQQWHYHNDGSLAQSVPGADANIFEAWKQTTGSNKVVVAIIDGGIDLEHEDLKANLWTNEKEANGVSGLDDDGDGYVDDVHGWNFVTNSAVIYPHNHGTHVAGTVGAVNNNGIGVAGVAGGDGTPGSGVRMMSCQVFDSRSGAGQGNFAEALVYAAEHGADIAQCSWGWAEPEYYEQPVLDAIDYFTNEATGNNLQGGLCIFAVGNDGKYGNFYPAAYPTAMSVAAMTCELTPATYSNYGEYIDVTAPGGDVTFGESFGVLSTLPDNKYGFMDGTSMATPHVSGIAALILAQYGSPSLPASTLRTQLSSSVNDFYTRNPQAEGLFGQGYIDGAKALVMGTGTAPSAVENITLSPSQDNILVEWIIPASEDNNVNHHLIYYSTEAFTAESDLSKIPYVAVDTKFASSGDKWSCTIENLRALTTYYIAMKAVNRWGDASPLSKVVTGKTNAGSKMTLSTDPVNFTTGPGNEGFGTFTIGNADEGLLRWSVASRTTSAMLKAPAAQRPAVASNGTAKADGPKAKSAPVVTLTDYVASDYPKQYTYSQGIYAYIGEDGDAQSDSEAQWFRITEDNAPQGFNLTHIKVGGSSTGFPHPTIQVYKGATMTSQSLVLEWTPDFFVYDYNLALPEQLYFAPGESFWIAVHFAKEKGDHPLGMGTAENDMFSSYSMMSTDFGKTWVTLAEALKGSRYESMAPTATWHLTAVSQNPDWTAALEFDPSQGMVRQGESQEVKVKAGAAPLVNGTYNFKLSFDTNESEKSNLTLPVTVTVEGNKAELKTDKIVEFGSLLVGQSKTIVVEVFNSGYGSFRGSQWSAGIYSDNISSTSEHFKGPEAGVPSGFQARSATQIELTYTPKSEGAHTGSIIFTDVNGEKFSITVHGVASEPAKIVIEPTTVNAGDLDVDAEATTKTFTIKNEGKYPLEFVMPRFSDEQIEGIAGGEHKYGYTLFNNVDEIPTFEYDNNPALIGGTNVVSSFTDDNIWSGPISLGFEFPFYGKSYSEVYVNSQGAITFATTEDRPWDPVSETTTNFRGVGVISAYGRTLNFGPQSKVEYAKLDGKFVVKYTDVLATVYGEDYTPISFHFALSANGDIEVYYDHYEGSELFQEGRSLFLGILDPEMSDPLVFTSIEVADGSWDEPTVIGQRFTLVHSGSAFKFVAPKPWFVKSVSPASGIVTPGETVEVTATLKADATMNAGATFNNLVVMSNDPAQSTSFVHFDANITGKSLAAEAVLEQNILDFGKVMRTSEQTKPLTVKNAGRRAFEIKSVKVAGGKFASNITLPATVDAGMSKDIYVTLPTEQEGTVSDKITVETSVGTLTADLKGEVGGVPVMTLSYESVDETAEYGQEVNIPLTIGNEGNETLRYAITPSDIVVVPAVTDPTAKTEYIYSASQDDSSVKFEWVDIETTGLGTQNNYTYYLGHDYIEVELPFAFPYYGKTYNKMYIYNTGFVSFTKRNDEKIWPEPPADFPGGTIYTNIIAPYWGLHTMDTNRTAGTYHYVSDNQAVVSWMEYGNSMNYGVCYQLILNSDGTFKFQYKGNGPDAVIFGAFGLAGISNEDGSEGIRLAERYLKFDTSLQFSPVSTVALEAGKTTTVELSLRTDLMGGTYDDVLNIATNVPGKEKIEIPVQLTVNGEPAPVLPEQEVTIQQTVGYMDYSEDKPYMMFGFPYGFDFAVANEGSAPFTIESIMIGNRGVDSGIGGFDPLLSNAKTNSLDDDMGVGGDDEEIDWSEFFQLLLVYGETFDEWTGETTIGWGPYQGMPIQIGKTPVKFALPIAPELSYMPGEYTVPLTLNIAGLDPENVIPYTMMVTFVVSPAPVLDINPFEEVRVSNAKDGEIYNEVVTLFNYAEEEGANLNYEVYLDPTGMGEEMPGGGGGIDPMLAPKNGFAPEAAAKNIVAHEKGTNVFDTPTDFEYNEALYYPAIQSGAVAYNYGSNSTYETYTAATAFTAPAGGINISHVYIISTMIDKPYDYNVQIVLGDNPESGSVAGRATATMKADDTYNPQSLKSQPMVIELEKPVYLSEGQNFYLVANYPAGNPYPSTLVSKEDDVVSNRYMGYTEQFGWFDVASIFNDQYGSLGYVMACLETKEGQPWLTLTGETSGVVVPGASAEVKLQFTPDTAPLDKGNMMMMVVKTNSPDAPIVNIPVYLDKNGAPIIMAPTSTVYAKEGMDTEMTFTVSEPDGDDFTIAISDESDAATIKAITCEGAIVEINGTEASVKGAQGDAEVSLVLSPEFGTLGVKRLNIFATDADGHSASALVNYVVERTNRAPQADADFTEVLLAKGSASDVISFGNIFTDPEGEDLTFELNIPDNNFVEVFTSGTNVIFYGKEIGTVRAALTATDPEGLSSTHEFDVKVADAMGIEGITVVKGVTVAPNPVVTTVSITTDFSAADVTYSVYSASGALVASETADAVEGVAHTMDLSALSSGIYFLKVNDTTVTLIKR